MIANVQALIPQYKSKTEQQYAQLGHAVVADEFGEGVVLTMYEPMAFYIPGGRFKPDFLHILESGALVFVEVKGSKKQKGYRDSRAKLRATAEVFPFFYWCMSVDLVIERIE